MEDLSPISKFANTVFSCGFENDIISDKVDVD